MVDVAQVQPLSRSEAMTLADVEYDRMLALLDDIGPDQWQRPTDCTEWTVKDLVGHLAAGAKVSVSIPWALKEFGRALVQARRAKRDVLDVFNGNEVARRAGMSPQQVLDEAREMLERARQARKRFPALLRPMPLPGIGVSAGQLNDLILTRDLWMHRVDLSRAIDRPLDLTPEHDGRFVADLVRDWAGQHGASFHLALEGPAGGEYSRGSNGEQIRIDAVEFARTLSGRAPGTGLLRWRVQF